MKLSQLLQAIGSQQTCADCEINQVTCDSRRVEKDSLFVCIKGLKFDGHDHAKKAIEGGAAAIVCQHPLDLGEFPNQFVVEDTREAYALLSAAICGNPAKSLKLVGVTGTNGKTTITNLIKHILESAGKKVGLIGTIHNEIGDMRIPAKHTTPDPGELHVLLKRMLSAGCEYVVMEASSHAMDQKRLFGCEFEAAVFTNLTQDHLDFHKTMAEYGAAKARLFQIARIGIANLDDNYYDMLMRQSACPLISYSLEQAAADLSAKQAVYYPSSVQFLALAEGQLARVKVTIYNALAALASARELGIDFNQAARALGKVGHVKGRAEIVPVPAPYTVMIDYDHTPDGMENILTAARGFCRGRLIVLFGCGGDRDRAKRPLMGRVADRLADQCIVTSDNPRSEAPEQIIREIVAGMGDTRREVIPDRRRAIARALEMAQKDDVVLLLGKGHETYQQIGQEKVHLDEREEIARFFADEGS